MHIYVSRFKPHGVRAYLLAMYIYTNGYMCTLSLIVTTFILTTPSTYVTTSSSFFTKGKLDVVVARFHTLSKIHTERFK